jgi:uncharacterized protein YceK
MRRLLVLPLLLVAVMLSGCSQVTQFAGDVVGVPVEETCATIDDAYVQYQSVIDQGGATEEQLDAARDDLVSTLNGLADEIDGQLGDLVRSGAQQLGDATDLQAPETVEAIEQLKESASAFCG